MSAREDIRRRHEDRAGGKPTLPSISSSTSASPRSSTGEIAGGAAAGRDFFVIGVVVRRARLFRRQGDDGPLWRASRTVLACFAAGLLCAAVAATIGFRLGFARMG